MLPTSTSTVLRRPGFLRTRLLLALCACSLALLVGPLTSTAHAEGTASTFVVDADLAADGTLKVAQTITFSGAAPATLTQKLESEQSLVGDRLYAYDITDVTATAGGAALPVSTTREGTLEVVSVTTNGADSITMGYTVRGAVVGVDGSDATALRWPLLQGLSAQVTEFSATVAIPGAFSYVRCTAGSPGSATPCDFAASGTEESPIPTFRDGPRGEGEYVVADIGFPAGSVASQENLQYRWTVGRAFSADPLPLGIALGLLVLGGLGLFALHRRAGADAKSGGQISRAGEFVPVGAGETEFRVVGDVRPGHVGTVVDERVDPIDVTATVLDLAVRGHLLITELPRSSEFARTDWTLSRTVGAPDELRPFESALLDGITPAGEDVRVSELPARVSESIGAVQDRLYDEVVAKGWYEQRPDATRSRWTQLAFGALIVAVVATGLLAAFTTYALIGLVLVLIGLGLVFVAQEMPSRTPKGAALLSGLGALRADLMTHPTNQMPAGQELRELSEVLPYAVVLGGSERWLAAIVAADQDVEADSTDLSWYHGPENWHLRDLPDSLQNFITSVSGSLFARR